MLILAHLDGNPTTFAGEDGLDRIIDARMQFGALGIQNTDRPFARRFCSPARRASGLTPSAVPSTGERWARRSHPVQSRCPTPLPAADPDWPLRPISPTAVRRAWRTVYALQNPPVVKADLAKVYRDGIDLLCGLLPPLRRRHQCAVRRRRPGRQGNGHQQPDGVRGPGAARRRPCCFRRRSGNEATPMPWRRRPPLWTSGRRTPSRRPACPGPGTTFTRTVLTPGAGIIPSCGSPPTAWTARCRPGTSMRRHGQDRPDLAGLLPPLRRLAVRGAERRRVLRPASMTSTASRPPPRPMLAAPPARYRHDGPADPISGGPVQSDRGGALPAMPPCAPGEFCLQHRS